MANKFQKSVLERLEQEAARQKRESRVAGQGAAPDSAVPQSQSKTPAKPEAAVKQQAVALLEPEPQVPPEQMPKRTTGIAAAPEPEAAPAVQQTLNGFEAVPGIDAFLRLTPQRQAKNKTFYLDVEVIEAVKGTAKAQRVTDSKLVNDILRRVLGVPD